MLKPRYGMLVIMLFFVLLLIYFLTLYSLSDLMSISIESLATFSVPLLTLSSIIVTAGIAIYVMKNNHKEDLKKREEERLAINELSIMKSEMILSTYINISEGYAKNIKTIDDIKKVTTEKILRELEDIIFDCRKIREFDYYSIQDRQVEIFSLTDELINISKNIENELIKSTEDIQPRYISKKFKQMNDSLEEYFIHGKYVNTK